MSITIPLVHGNVMFCDQQSKTTKASLGCPPRGTQDPTFIYLFIYLFILSKPAAVMFSWSTLTVLHQCKKGQGRMIDYLTSLARLVPHCPTSRHPPQLPQGHFQPLEALVW